MKKALFLSIFAVIGLLLAASIIKGVEIAIGGYIFSLIMLLEICFAQKKTRANNSLKLFFQYIGKWKIYRNISAVLCVIFIVFSTIALLSSM